MEKIKLSSLSLSISPISSIGLKSRVYSDILKKNKKLSIFARSPEESEKNSVSPGRYSIGKNKMLSPYSNNMPLIKEEDEEKQLNEDKSARSFNLNPIQINDQKDPSEIMKSFVYKTPSVKKKEEKNYVKNI